MNNRIPRPLEAICQQAMRLEAADRYPSASHLAAELKHWLADEPVAVHRDSPTTRLLRWSRHHKSLVGGIAGLLLTTLVALVATNLLVNEQKQAARRARDDAREANKRLQSALAEVEKERDNASLARLNTEVARDSLAVALRQTEEARDAAEAHIRLGLDVVDQLVTLGDRQLVTPPLAGQARLDLLEQSLAFLRAFRNRVPDDPGILTDSAKAARRLGHLYALIGRNDVAEPFYQESAAIAWALAGRQPGEELPGNLRAEALLDLADLQAARGQASQAAENYQQILAPVRESVLAHAEERMHEHTLARGLTRLGAALLCIQGRQEDALAAAEEAEAIMKRRAVASWPTIPQDLQENRQGSLYDQLEWASAAGILARALAASGQAERAEAQLMKALDRLDTLARRLPEGPVPQDLDYFQAYVATTLARILLDWPGASRALEAQLRLSSAVSLLEPLVEQHAEYVHFRAGLAEALVNRAEALCGISQYLPAKRDAEAARELLEELRVGNPDLPDYASLLGEALFELGRVEAAGNDQKAALELFDEAVAVQKQALAVNPLDPVYQRRLERVESRRAELGGPGG